MNSRGRHGGGRALGVLIAPVVVRGAADRAQRGKARCECMPAGPWERLQEVDGSKARVFGMWCGEAARRADWPEAASAAPGRAGTGQGPAWRPQPKRRRVGMSGHDRLHAIRSVRWLRR